MNRKTIFLKTAFLLACLIAGTLTAGAYDFMVDGIYYNISGGNASVTYKNTNYPSYSGQIVIPKTVRYNGHTYPVTSIGEEAFQRCYNLTSVTIGNSVTTIGDWAFTECENMTGVTFGSSVTNIGDYAFGGCTGLTSVMIPNSVTFIGDGAFCGCTSLTSVMISNSLTSISKWAFDGCSGLNSVTIPNSVTSIGEEAFRCCYSLTSVTIPNSVTSIGNGAFFECYGLTGNLTIPNSVTTIGDLAFYNCSSLTDVTIGNSVTTIGDYAFWNCSGLTGVTIGNSVTTIGRGAFADCWGLTRVNISDLESWCRITFGDNANPLCSAQHLFLNGSEVTNLIIPNSVTEINNYAFEGCSGLTSVTIPNSVTTIGDYAFYDCSGLTGNLTIPNSVTTIGDWAFYNCSSLTDVTIGNSVTSIGRGAFSGCSGLTGNLTIPNSVTSIGERAFSGCSGLTGNLTIPNSVTTIDDWTFNGCSGLTGVTIGNSVTTIGGDAFFYCSGLTGNLVIPNSVTTIGERAFYNCSSLTDVTIGNSVTSIGQRAFYDCSSMICVTIGNSVTTIGRSAFEGCSPTQLVWNAKNCSSNGYMTTSNITQMSIGPEVEVLPSDFVAGSQIASVDIPNSVTTIGSGAFSGCSGLTGNLTIPNSVTTIGNSAFYGCSGLTSVTIPNLVTTIGSYAFFLCSGLTSVIVESGNTKYDSRDNCNAIIETASNTLILGCMNSIIPNSVTTIGDRAFEGCSGLTGLTIPNSVTTISNSAFQGCTGLTGVAIIGEGEWKNANNGNLFQNVKTLLIGSGITAIRGLQCTPTEVWCNAINPPICDDNTFTSYSGALHVPAEAMVDYFTAEYWQNFYDLRTDAGGKVTLSQRAAAISLGETVQLSAVINPAGSTLVWQSLNPSVATVNENGLVTAVGLGECDIIAHLTPNFVVADTCHITVTPGEITLTLSEESLTMERGDEVTLSLAINPVGTTLTPVWTSSDESIATVTDAGVVRAVGYGECDITATVIDKTVTCHVTVGGQVVITLDQTSVNVAVGSIVALYPSATPDVELELTVTSSDPTVAIARVMNRVNGALAAPALVGTKMIQVIGIKEGCATITVGSADGSAIPATAIVIVGNGGSIPGDVDGDGNIGIGDVVDLIDLLLNGGTDNPSADADGDGHVTIGDVTEIIDMLLSGN